MRAWRLLGLGLCAALSLVPAHAQPVPFAFTGSVTQINSDPADPFAGGIHLGTGFSGSFVFNSATADGLPADPVTGSYDSSGTAFRTMVDLGGRVFTVNAALHIGVANNYSGAIDQYTVVGRNADGSTVLELLLEDPGGSAFSGDALPLTPPSLTGFTVTRFTFTAQDVDGNYVEILGNVSSLALLAPTIDSISPSTAWAGSQVTIHGSGFIGDIQVFFNGVAGVVEIVDENTLIVTIPPMPSGPVTVTVTTPGGSATAAQGSLALQETSIPTLSEWALLFLCSALLTIGLNHLRRRKNWIPVDFNFPVGTCPRNDERNDGEGE